MQSRRDFDVTWDLVFVYCGCLILFLFRFLEVDLHTIENSFRPFHPDYDAFCTRLLMQRRIWTLHRKFILLIEALNWKLSTKYVVAQSNTSGWPCHGLSLNVLRGLIRTMIRTEAEDIDELHQIHFQDPDISYQTELQMPQDIQPNIYQGRSSEHFGKLLWSFFMKFSVTAKDWDTWHFVACVGITV